LGPALNGTILVVSTVLILHTMTCLFYYVGTLRDASTFGLPVGKDKRDVRERSECPQYQTYQGHVHPASHTRRYTSQGASWGRGPAGCAGVRR